MAFNMVLFWQFQVRPWSTMGCSLPDAGTTNRNFLMASRVKAFQKDRPIPARPYPRLRTWTAVWSGVISVSPRNWELPGHLQKSDQPPWFYPACMPRTTSIHVPTLLTIAITNYTRAPTLTNSSAIPRLALALLRSSSCVCGNSTTTAQCSNMTSQVVTW